MLNAPPSTPHWMLSEIENGVYEKIEQQWCAELPGGDAILELGAGIGIVTRVLQQRYRSVVCVEANHELSLHWSRNVMPAPVLGGCTHIELRHGMIGGGSLHVARNEWWKSTGSPRVTTAQGEIVDVAVPELSLCELIEDVAPDAIMCDIEGAEYPSLVSAADSGMLGRVRDVIVELHPGLWLDQLDGNRLRAAMTDAGFTNIRECRADGWPPGTPHPLDISHVWWRRA